MTRPQLFTSLSVSAITVLALGSYAVGEFDPQVFQTQLDNHEQRITTLEQASTSPTPSSSPVATSSSQTTTSVAATPDPTPSATPTLTPDPTPTPTNTVVQTTYTQPNQHTWTRSDIDSLMQSIAPPGEMQPQKEAACRKQGSDYGYATKQIDDACNSSELSTYASY